MKDKSNKISYIHDKTYIVLKDENTTEIYSITKTAIDSGNGGSKFTFTIPTDTDADKGGKCINGEYKACSTDENNKCPSSQRIYFYK